NENHIAIDSKNNLVYGVERKIATVDIEDLMPYINYRLQSLHHSISITGGEPLLFTDFIRALAQKVKQFNVPLFLETNGTLPQQLEKVIDIIDIISM
ncbi:MAG TPA: 4Fe-4S cluster-binding domain-containing protein, partial [Megamonas funiformis]|nr:4Fe-4S cluster-binding domain-containing protein [Megamonas funiformis]